MGSVFSFCLDYSYPFNCSLTLYTMRLEIITIDMSYVFRVRAIAIAGAHCKLTITLICLIYYIGLSAARLQPSTGKQEMKYKPICM